MVLDALLFGLKGIKMKKLLFSVFLLCLSYSVVHADWSDPVNVITGNWGMYPQEFGYKAAASNYVFPRLFGVDVTGDIVIADQVQNKIKVYSNNGLLKFQIPAPLSITNYPAALVVNGGCAVVGYASFTHIFDIATGSLTHSLSNMGGAKYVNSDCSRIFTLIDDNGEFKWRIYSAQGVIIDENISRPLEIGRIDTKYMGNGQYQHLVQFDSAQWTITGAFESAKFYKSSNGTLYMTQGARVVEFDSQGTEISSLTIPSDNIEIGPDPGNGTEPIITFHEVYGGLTISPLGDIYCWKRTPTTYSIIKWTHL